MSPNFRDTTEVGTLIILGAAPDVLLSWSPCANSRSIFRGAEPPVAKASPIAWRPRQRLYTRIGFFGACKVPSGWSEAQDKTLDTWHLTFFPGGMPSCEVPAPAAISPGITRLPCPRLHSLHFWRLHVTKASRQRITAFPRGSRLRAASTAEQTLEDVKPAFDRCTTESDFLQTLKSALNHPKAPDFLFPAFHDFYNNYKGMNDSFSKAC